MNSETKKVHRRLTALKTATATELAKATDLSLTDTYRALVSLEAQSLAAVRVTHNRVGVGYIREWVAA